MNAQGMQNRWLPCSLRPLNGQNPAGGLHAEVVGCMLAAGGKGGRSTFATCEHYKQDSPLLVSGLVGPVRRRISK